MFVHVTGHIYQINGQANNVELQDISIIQKFNETSLTRLTTSRLRIVSVYNEMSLLESSGTNTGIKIDCHHEKEKILIHQQEIILMFKRK
jgi:hypothetical protein